MLIEPQDLPAKVVADAITNGWGWTVDTITYAPVGFGSHHWNFTDASGRRWFATIDDLRMGDRSAATLVGALETAAELAAAGLDFVVAPRRMPDGKLVSWVTTHYALAVYPYVDGTTAEHGRYESHDKRLQVIERLVELHDVALPVQSSAPVDSLLIPERSHLEKTLENLDRSWDSGPFAEEAQALLRQHRTSLEGALKDYDRLATRVNANQDHWVITHGEPHCGNTIFTHAGVHLIDWETARLAPRERDLWSLIDEDDRSHHAYSERSGHEINASALDLYRRWWDLCEVSLYTHDLRRPHDDSAETRIAANSLRDHMARAVAPHDVAVRPRRR